MSGDSEFLESEQPPPKKVAVEPRPFRIFEKDGIDDAGSVDERPVRLESVRRLEAESAEAAPPPELDEAATVYEAVKPVFKMRGKGAPQSPEVTGRWGQASKRSYIWMFWTGVGALVAIIGGLAIQPLLREQRPESERSFFEGYEVVEEVVTGTKESPIKYFEENADVVAREMQVTLKRYAHAKTIAEVMPLVRDSERLKIRLLEFWRPWRAPDGWEPPDASAMGYGSAGDRPYAFMKGQRPDFAPFQMYFVREDGRMLVDWEASEGLGTHTFEELKDPKVKEAVMRVIASPAVYYSPQLSEEHYRAFQLTSRDGQDFIWGYAEIGTPEEEQLSRLFKPGVILNEQTAAESVRLSLTRGPAGSQPSQWRIIDMLHKGWVAP